MAASPPPAEQFQFDSANAGGASGCGCVSVLVLVIAFDLIPARNGWLTLWIPLGAAAVVFCIEWVRQIVVWKLSTSEKRR